MALTNIQLGDKKITIDDSIAERIYLADAEMRKATGTPLMIAEAYRSSDRQKELYEKSQRGEIGRAAPPGKSYHEKGLAVDVTNWDVAEPFLRRYGLANDLADDKNHFSFGETNKAKNTNLVTLVDSARKQGATDTDILNHIANTKPGFRNLLTQARASYGEGESDRELLNYLSVRFSGKSPTVQSNPLKPKADPSTRKTPGEGETAPESQYGASFPSKPGSDTPAVAVLKMFGNIPSSVFNLAKGIWDLAGKASQATSPQGLAAGISNTVGFAKRLATNPVGTLTDTALKTTDAMDSVFDYLGERYGSIENIQRTLTEDPVGVFLDLTAASEVANAARGFSSGSQVARRAEQISDVTKNVGAVVGRLPESVGKTGEFVTSQVSGLSPETLRTISKNPDRFTRDAMVGYSRETVADKVKNAMETRIQSLQETGKGYEAIRKSKDVVSVPQGYLQDVLKKWNIGVDDAGTLLISKESMPMSSAELNALQDFVNTYGKEAELSGNAFLNARKSLDNMAKYDSMKTDASTIMARDLRTAYDELGKKQLGGLKELDAQYGPEVRLLNQLKRDYFKPDGSLKDGAYTKIANLTNKGREQLLSRLELVAPGITEDIRILKAIEDIEYAKGQKVGTYLRSGLSSGGILAGVITGNLPLVVGALLLNPSVIVPLIRRYGQFKQLKSSMIDGVVRKVKSGKPLTAAETNLISDVVKDADRSFEQIKDRIIIKVRGIGTNVSQPVNVRTQ